MRGVNLLLQVFQNPILMLQDTGLVTITSTSSAGTTTHDLGIINDLIALDCTSYAHTLAALNNWVCDNVGLSIRYI